ncbi:SWIM zinc finger family protein [Bradyrhizobium sp. LTSPM299]|uniref:SWIM zinc finger family protein n=1 Tax=Bradyrhizobium sp. LTSPM299 TaxID=1619233 RepID=UPI001FDAADD1|nr:SWIM zinc finger family protein [Bradyrhizobium sp. LTSPM299]
MTIEGRTIANSFWGKSWCTNLEHYSDFESRMPRGRTYVRNGSVVDLQIAQGEVTAMVAGSSLYKIKVTVAPVVAARWKAICRDCAGEINSVVELLQGRLAKGVMDRVCRQGDGLFPSPKEIKLSCSCPDGADMCKHVAAALYGVGARLDERPQLLFELRGVDESELLANAGEDLALTKVPSGAANILDNSDVAALFGLDMAEAVVPEAAVPTAPKRQSRSGMPGGSKATVVKKTAPKAKAGPKTKNGRPLAEPARSESKKASRGRASGRILNGAPPRRSVNP